MVALPAVGPLMEDLAGSRLFSPAELPAPESLVSAGLAGGVAGAPAFPLGGAGGGGGAGVLGVAKSWLMKISSRGLGGVAQALPASFVSPPRVRAISS